MHKIVCMNILLFYLTSIMNVYKDCHDNLYSTIAKSELIIYDIGVSSIMLRIPDLEVDLCVF